MCIYMCVYIYTHTHTHTHIYIYIYTAVGLDIADDLKRIRTHRSTARAYREGRAHGGGRQRTKKKYKKKFKNYTKNEKIETIVQKFVCA
jgi:hypothetical protein